MTETKMRAGQHNGKKSQKTGKVIKPPHNDEDRRKNPNVKAEWVDRNIYWNCYDGEYTEADKYMLTDEGEFVLDEVGERIPVKERFEDVELKFYEENYGTALEVQNEKHIKARQYKRTKNMEDWLDSPRYAPTETILRCGNVDVGYVGGDDLYEMLGDYIEYLENWSVEHGNCLHILDWALHADEFYTDADDDNKEKESSSHVHLRFVMDYKDFYIAKNGNKVEYSRVGIDKALEQAGYDPPKPDRREGRYNNRMMTFTAETRTVWQGIIQYHGYDIETTPRPERKRARDRETYVKIKLAEREAEKAREMQEAAELDKENTDAFVSLIEYERGWIEQGEVELDYKEECLEEREQRADFKENELDAREDYLEERVDLGELRLKKKNNALEKRRAALDRREADLTAQRDSLKREIGEVVKEVYAMRDGYIAYVRRLQEETDEKLEYYKRMEADKAEAAAEADAVIANMNSRFSDDTLIVNGKPHISDKDKQGDMHK